MSVTESDPRGFPEPSDAGPVDRWGDGPAAYEPGERAAPPGDRTPPQDIAAEQSVLGSMLLSKDAIADVSEALAASTSTGPHTSSSTTRSSTSTAAASRPTRSPWPPSCSAAASCQRVGGAPYLHTLSANVPIAANAGYYAEIVREKAILRRLVDAGTKIVQIGYAGEGQVDDMVDRPRPRSTRSPTSAPPRTTRR